MKKLNVETVKASEVIPVINEIIDELEKLQKSVKAQPTIIEGLALRFEAARRKMLDLLYATGAIDELEWGEGKTI